MIAIDELDIVNYPHPALRGSAVEVAEVNDEVRAVAKRMIALMHEAPGVGLAAPQVGLNWRMFVANATGEPEDDRVFINPVLKEPTRETDEYEEGCLSLPDIKGVVRRPIGVTIEALDLEGEPIAVTSDEFDARIWQHEFDHLEGVLIIDRMAPIDKMANRKSIKALEKSFDG